MEAMKNSDFVKYINEAISGKLVRARYGNNVTYRYPNSFSVPFSSLSNLYQFADWTDWMSLIPHKQPNLK